MISGNKTPELSGYIVGSNKCGSRGFNPTISLSVGGSRIFPFLISLLETISDLARNPASFDGVGRGSSVYLSQKMGLGVPNLKKN